MAALLRAGVVSTAGRGRTVSPCGTPHGTSEQESASWGLWQKGKKVPAKSAGHTEMIGREENVSICSLEQMSNGNSLTEYVSLMGLQLTNWNMLLFNY